MPLEDDLRHSQRSIEARQKSIDALGPTVKECMLLTFEMTSEEFQEWRDFVKASQRRRLKESDSRGTIRIEVLKWTVVTGLAGAFGWISTHWDKLTGLFWSPK